MGTLLSAEEKTLLSGKRILVTRPALQAKPLMDRLKAEKAQPVGFPAIAIERIAIGDDLKEKIGLINQYQKLIFISTNAVRVGLEVLTETHTALSGSVQCFAIGRATEVALNRYGIKTAEHNLQSDTGIQNSESLLGLEALHDVSGESIGIFCGLEGRNYLENCLSDRGAEVHRFELYKRTMPAYDKSFLKRQLIDAKVDAILATSAQIVTNLVEMAESDHVLLKSIPIIVAGDRIGKIARESGFSNISISIRADDDSMMSALKTYFMEANDRL